uniref:exo-alpha-sialidase n=1 Tax=Salvator merianae TaxID=96440 RepID=A0A8D0DM88_SALMN
MVESQVGFEKVTLFRQEAPGGLTYRIPALLYLPSESAFLAFAEERSSPRDEDAKFLVMRRGQKEGTSVKWQPQESLMTATLPNYRTMNPCPVYESKTGVIFLFFICVEKHVTERTQIRTGRNAARLCYVTSQDGGRTWSQTTDLTERVIGDDLKNWATFAVGPGHGAQLTSGRLVIPSYTYYIHQRCFGHGLVCWTKPHCVMFYSDDCGQSWTKGDILKTLVASECQVAELATQDGSRVLYCNARSAGRFRAEAFSADGGEMFVRLSHAKNLSQPPGGCQGSVVSFSPLPELTVPSSLAPSALIFSHPTSRHKRLDLGIYLNTSPLEHDSWRLFWQLHKGPSGYSDLVVWQEEKKLLFGCFFECGQSNSDEEIAFQLFTLPQL